MTSASGLRLSRGISAALLVPLPQQPMAAVSGTRRWLPISIYIYVSIIVDDVYVYINHHSIVYCILVASQAAMGSAEGGAARGIPLPADAARRVGTADSSVEALGGGGGGRREEQGEGE